MVNVLPADSSTALSAPASAGAEAPHAPVPGAANRGFGSFVWLFSAGFALGGFKIGLRQLHDNSFFVHLTTGRWILDHGIPHADAYSFTAAGKPFVAQSWLAELLYGALDRSVVGPFGIRLVMGLTAATIAVLLFRLALELCHDRKRAAGIGLVAFGVVATMFSERPLGFGLLGLAVVLWIVEVPNSRVGRVPELSLPVVMWLWGNVHGSMALGFLYIGLHVVGRMAEGVAVWRPSRERRLVVASIIALVVLVVNPYGIDILLFPVELLGKGDVLKDVLEWMSPNFHTASGMAFAAWLVVALTVLMRGKRPTRRDIVVVMPFLLLSVWALRNLAIAAMVMLPVVARSAAVEEERSEPQNYVLGRFLGVAIIGLAAVFGLQALGQKQFDERGYSRDAYRYLQAHELAGKRMLTTDANAGWVLAAHFPEQHVFMDDRYDMFPREIIDDYVAISRVRPTALELLDQYRIEVVVWPNNNPLTQLLVVDRDHWVRTYRDKSWTVFTRR